MTLRSGPSAPLLTPPPRRQLVDLLDEKCAGAEFDYLAANGFTYQKSAPPPAKSWTDYAITTCHGSAEGVKKPIHGHHVIMKKGHASYADEYIKPAQQILAKYGINPFTGCKNLVVARNWCHSEKYAKFGYDTLAEADAKYEDPIKIHQALAKIVEYHTVCKQPGMADAYDEV